MLTCLDYLIKLIILNFNSFTVCYIPTVIIRYKSPLAVYGEGAMVDICLSIIFYGDIFFLMLFNFILSKTVKYFFFFSFFLKEIF